MTDKRILATYISALLLNGCATPDPEAKISEAAKLAEQHSGRRPMWSVPWDEDSTTLDGNDSLSLDEGLALALRNNLELRADLEMIGQADADLVQAGLLSNPVISFMLMFPSGGGRTMLRANALPMQPLQDLWLIPARKKVAAAALRQAVLRVADRAVETVAAVKKAYIELQYAERAVQLIIANMKLVEQSTDIFEVRQTTGQGSQVLVNLSRIRHERLRSDLLSMEAQRLQARYDLLLLMGLAEGAIDWRVQPLRESEKLPPAWEDESDLILLAAEQRLDLKSREWQTEAALRRIKLARREGWPDLTVGFTFERAPRGRTRGAGIRALAADSASQALVERLSDSMAPPTITKIAPLPRPTRDVTYTLGSMIELEFPIFDWGQAQTAKAIHEYRQRLAEYDDLLQKIVRSVRTTLTRQREAFQQFRLFGEVILPQVERNMELSRQAYVANESDLTVYLQTQEDVIGTRYKMLDVLKAYLLLDAELERAVGGSRLLDKLRSPTTAPTTEAANEND